MTGFMMGFTAFMKLAERPDVCHGQVTIFIYYIFSQTFTQFLGPSGVARHNPF